MKYGEVRQHNSSSEPLIHRATVRCRQLMALEPGSRLGPYEIVELRGKGGMGEVYLGRDTRLERDVAIKVLPEELGQDTLYRQRLEREAKTISQLTHPHVCTLYDIGSEDGVDYLVMEYLEGETLEDRLRRGALPLDEVATIGSQIAEAIDAAHRQGVVHRDLKPGNVMLTREGAKVLDFGLAKGVQVGALSGSTQTPTITQPLTSEGSILGTLQYMAPEQLEGKEADTRSDIWGLGAVLYEMASGARPFEGTSQASLIASIMTGRVRALSELQPLAPARFDWVIERCLDKDPDRRWQSARDVALELGGLDQGTETAAPTGGTADRALRPRVAALAGGLVLLVGMVIGFAFPRGSNVPAVEGGAEVWTVTTLDIAADEGLATISPDGRTLVFPQQQAGGGSILARRSLDSLFPQPISGTEGAGGFAFFSPDGGNLVFVDSSGKLKTVAVEGGGATTIAENVFSPGPWGEDGSIYYTHVPSRTNPNEAEIWRVAVTGGEPERIGDGMATALLPGGQTLLATLPQDRREGFWADLVAVDLGTGEGRVLTQGAAATYVEPGLMAFYRSGALWAAPIDSVTGELAAPPRQVETEVARVPGIPVDIGRFDVQKSGDLVYVRGQVSNQSRLVWVNRGGGEVEPVAPEIKAFAVPRPSLDGHRISVHSRNSAGDGNEQWALDLATGSWSRPAQTGSTSVATEIPPDGKEIFFVANRVDDYAQVFFQPADRSAPAQRLLPSEQAQSYFGVSADGRWVLLYHFFEEGFVALDRSSGEVRSVVDDSVFVRSGGFHPDGDWIAYAGFDPVDAMSQLWLIPFPGPGEPRQLTFEGGQEAAWSSSGDEIFYRGPTHMMTIPIEKKGSELVIGRPETLFEDRFRRGPNLGIINYGVHPDGRFLMVEAAEDQEEKVILVQNWRAKVLEMFSEGGS